MVVAPIGARGGRIRQALQSVRGTLQLALSQAEALTLLGANSGSSSSAIAVVDLEIVRRSNFTLVPALRQCSDKQTMPVLLVGDSASLTAEERQQIGDSVQGIYTLAELSSPDTIEDIESLVKYSLSLSA